MTYAQACEKARAESEHEGCTSHVAAILHTPSDGSEPVITGYCVSDWYDGATVATYTNGVRR